MIPHHTWCRAAQQPWRSGRFVDAAGALPAPTRCLAFAIRFAAHAGMLCAARHAHYCGTSSHTSGDHLVPGWDACGLTTTTTTTPTTNICLRPALPVPHYPHTAAAAHYRDHYPPHLPARTSCGLFAFCLPSHPHHRLPPSLLPDGATGYLFVLPTTHFCSTPPFHLWTFPNIQACSHCPRPTARLPTCAHTPTRPTPVVLPVWLPWQPRTHIPPHCIAIPAFPTWHAAAPTPLFRAFIPATFHPL